MTLVLLLNPKIIPSQARSATYIASHYHTVDLSINERMSQR
jgi:hypothetical protein